MLVFNIIIPDATLRQGVFRPDPLRKPEPDPQFAAGIAPGGEMASESLPPPEPRRRIPVRRSPPAAPIDFEDV